MKKTLLGTFILFSFVTLVPVKVWADSPAPKLNYSGFVKCDGELKSGASEKDRQTKCDFAALIGTIVSLVNWAFYISIPIAVVLLAWGGLLYITGVPKNIDKAKSMFTAVVVGFVIMVVAWFVVRQAVIWFVDDPAATTFVK
jgi:hypothetical protein